MPIDRLEDFYRSYGAFKRYRRPTIKAKHLRLYDREFWAPARCTTDISVLELGSGPGEFLAYLSRKGVRRFLGVEMNADAVAVVPPEVADRVHVGDIWQYLRDAPAEPRWTHVVMLDVLEHFTPMDGVRLLESIKRILAPGGAVVARVPNMGSPWGAAIFHGDLTHRSAYTVASLEQLGLAAGLEAVAFLPHRRGPWLRRLLEGCLNALLERIVTTSPGVWTANVTVIYRPIARG